MNTGFTVNYSTSRDRAPYRVISFFTLIAFSLNFLFGDILVEKSWAQHVAPTSSSASLGFDPGIDTSLAEQIGGKKFIIPASLGEITNSYFPKELATGANSPASAENNGIKTIIHIQDAHCEYNCQKQISGIIKYLNEEYGIESVNLEGGEGNYDLGAFSSIEDKALREKVADYFMREGVLSGAEYFAVNDPGKVKLWGVENTELYLENLNAYRGSLNKRAPAEEALKKLNKMLGEIKEKIYSPELIEIDRMFLEHSAGKIEIREYISYLVGKAGEKMVDVKKFPNVYFLKFAMEEEKNIDFKQANIERDKLIDILQNKLSLYELEKLVEQTVLYKRGDIPGSDFYSYLFKISRPAGVDTSEFTALHKYKVYVSIYSAVDRAMVMEELDTLKASVMEEFYVSPQERALEKATKDLKILNDMFGISLTRKDYSYYLDNKEIFDSGEYLDAIKAGLHELKMNADLTKEKRDIDDYRLGISRFFELSFQRDDIFFMNSKIPVPADGTGKKSSQAAIMITGGFHSDNLLEIFKKNGVAYVSITPNFKIEEDNSNPYFALLGGASPPLFDYMENRISNLAIYSYFCGAASQRVNGLSPGEIRNIVLSAASALGGEKSREISFGEAGKVTFILSIERPEGAELVSGAGIDGKDLWAVWESPTLDVSETEGAEIKGGFIGKISAFFFAAMNRTKDIFRRTFISFFIVFISLFPLSAYSAETLPIPETPVSIALPEYSLSNLLRQYNKSPADIMQEGENFIGWLNKVPGTREENVKLDSERRLFQVITVLLELPDETLRVYREADKVVEEVQKRGVNIDINILDYVSLLLTESDGGHILKGREITLSNGGKHKFSDGVAVSSAGAVSHMQIMKHMVEGVKDKKGNKIARGLNDIIGDGKIDPGFKGDTLEETRYMILKGMGLTEPIEWERLSWDRTYADRVGLAIYLISAFDINRWNVIKVGDKYEILTSGQLKERYPDIRPDQFSPLGFYVAGLAGTNPGDIYAAAYNYGVSGVRKALEEVLTGKNLFDVLPPETARQVGTSLVFSAMQTMLYNSGILDISAYDETYKISFSIPEVETPPSPSEDESAVAAEETPDWMFSLKTSGAIIGLFLILFTSAGIALLVSKKKGEPGKEEAGEEDEEEEDLKEEPADNGFPSIFRRRYIESLENSLSQGEGKIPLLFDENGSLESVAEKAENFHNGDKTGFKELIERFRDEEPAVVSALITALSETISDMDAGARGNIAKGFDGKELQEALTRSGDVTTDEIEIAVKKVSEAGSVLINKIKNIPKYDISGLGLTEGQLNMVIAKLEDPINSFGWFRTVVVGKEKYLLGTQSALAVDLVDFLVENQGKGGYPDDLLEEYILHEAMESLDISDDLGRKLSENEKHIEIIKRTSVLFARGSPDKEVFSPGETPLGLILRKFIDERVEFELARALEASAGYEDEKVPKETSSQKAILTFFESTPESPAYIVCPPGEEIDKKGLGAEFMKNKMFESMKTSEKGFYKDLFGGDKFYSFVLGDVPTEEPGRVMDRETVRSPFSKVSGAVRRWAELRKTGNIITADSMGLDEAREAVIKIKNFAAEKAGRGIDPKSRINCSVSENVWSQLNEEDRAILTDNTMLSIVKDNIEDSKGKMVYALPYGRLHNAALARLNVAHYIENSGIDTKDDAFKQVLMSYANALALVSNNDNAERIFYDLLNCPDPGTFITGAIVRIYLPPISKINPEIILEAFLAEAEVLRSL